MRSKDTKLNIAIGPIWGEIGGVPNHVLGIIKHSKHHFHLIKYSPLSLYYPNYRGIGSALLTHPSLALKDIYGLIQAKMILPQYDIVHTHGHPYWWELYQKPKKTKAKYIHNISQIFFKEDSRNEREWKLEKVQNEQLIKYCRNVDIVISVAKWLQKLLLERYNISSVLIPNAVDTSEFKHGSPERFKNKYGIEKDFSLFVGRLYPYKRPELFVELAKRLPERLFLMIGAGVTQKNLRNYLGFNPPENVKCLGTLPRDELADAYAACKVFVLPSKNETFGIALLEAMASKKIVIAANNAGPKEIITHRKEGYLFEPDEIDDFYEKAQLAWEHPELGLNGYEKVKREYDWDIVIKQVDELYEKIVS